MTPRPPEQVEPSTDDPRYGLWKNVKDALRSIPFYFRTTTSIEGLSATDLFTLNATLGATIEVQVVETLNDIRKVWDPNDQWQRFGFERQSQTFPDVRLVARGEGQPEIPFAVELKGWYLLSKEGEPSFRYSVTPSACSQWDLLVVVPWYLDNVLSGSPRVLSPFITSARYAAEYRNYWWQHVRNARSDTRIQHPEVQTPPPYPMKADRLSDRPMSDSGNNFGRVARIGLMDEYVTQTCNVDIAGIRARHWVDFFKMYAESTAAEEIDQKLSILRNRRDREESARANHQRTEDLLTELFHMLRDE